MTQMAADKKKKKTMAYQETTFDGIVVDSRDIAWVKDTHIKVLHIARLANDDVIDLAEIKKSFRTKYTNPNGTWRALGPILENWQVLSALAYFGKNKEVCEKQISDGEAEPVYRLTRSQRSKSGFFKGFSMMMANDRLRLLQGSQLRQDSEPLEREGNARLLADRQKWIDEGRLHFQDGSFLLTEDLPIMSRRDVSSLTCGYPNSGNESPPWEQLWPAKSDVTSWDILSEDIVDIVGQSEE